MTYEPSNSDLYSLIHKLYDKVENLEKKIDKISVNRAKNIETYRSKLGLEEPEIYTHWVSFIKVEPSHFNNLFLLSGGVVNVFKDIVSQHITRYPSIPLYKYSNKLYVYHSSDGQREPEWEIFDETHLSQIVTEIWRKMIGVQSIELQDNNDDIELIDRKRQIVIHMRRKLLDVKKTRTYILKWLREIL